MFRFRKVLLPLAFCMVTGTAISQTERVAKEDVLEDLELMRSLFLEAHYAPFTYTTKEEFEQKYQEVYQSIKADSLSRFEIISTYQKFVSVLNNGHTEIDFPVEKYIEYLSNGGTLFPFELAFEDGKALIRKNWSDNQLIQTGWQVLEINGESVPDILDQIKPQVSAERPYFKLAKIELFSFPRYYWQVFGETREFEIKIRNEAGPIELIKVSAISGIEDFEMQREEILNASMVLRVEENHAYLNPGNFSGDLEKFEYFIDSCFTEIRTSKAENLIIDLRNNAGGDNEFSDYLVSYIANKRFSWNHSFELRTSRYLKEVVRSHFDTTTAYNQQILKHQNGERYEYHFKKTAPQPKKRRYKGDVYVLVNRQSHSQSAVTAAQIQDYHFGTIVGEETGDYPSLIASQFTYVLPKTAVSVKLSKGRIVRVNGSTKPEGVVPDIIIRDHLLDENDEILEGLVQRLKQH